MKPINVSSPNTRTRQNNAHATASVFKNGRSFAQEDLCTKNGKWAWELLAAPRPDGSWRPFHTLSAPKRGTVISTKQAIRRLAILGFSYEDAPMRLAIQHPRACSHACADKIPISCKQESVPSGKMPDGTLHFCLFTSWSRRKSPWEPPQLPGSSSD